MDPFLNKDKISHLDDRTVYGEHNKKFIISEEKDYIYTDWIASGDWANDPSTPVIYRINKDGFRSNHFEKINNEEITILFGGCSWTFGEGIPEEYTWTNLLCKKIQQKINKPVKCYSTAYMGSSIDLIIKNTMAFIRNYGKPTYLFLLLPDNARKVVYDSIEKKYLKVFPNVNWLKESKNNIQKKYTLTYEFENNVYDNLNLLHLLEDYCNESGIKLLWSSWNIGDYFVYESSKFNNFIKENPEEKYFTTAFPREWEGSYYENPNNIPYWKVAKDNCHPGTAWTHFNADLFFQKALEYEYF